MLNVFRRELRANLKSVLIWAAVMAVMTVLGLGEYAIVMGEGSAADINAIVNMMPRILRVMMGMGTASLNTPEGWFVCMYLWCALIAYLYAALLGAGILSKEERDRTAEVLFSKPVTRVSIIAGKLLAAMLYTLSVCLVCWLSAILVFAAHAREATLMATMHQTLLVGMPATSLVFLFLGLFLSAVCTGRGRAVQCAAGALIGAYFISVAIEMVGTVDYLSFLTPFRYFDASRVLTQGLSPRYALLSAGLVLALGGLTCAFYANRDLRA